MGAGILPVCSISDEHVEYAVITHTAIKIPEQTSSATISRICHNYSYILPLH